MSNENEIENDIQAKGLNSPRLTPDMIRSTIRDADYHIFAGSCLTVCCLTLTNGFTVSGESACASPENFDAEIGRKIAYENAKDKIWMLEGYLLKQKLFEATSQSTPYDRLVTECAELHEKYVKLTAFFDTEVFSRLPEPEKSALVEQGEHMLKYVTVLDRRVSKSF